jgi:DNA-binding XRE family transcriptional regulator
MPAKKHFTPEQREIILATAKKIWRKKFEWMKKATKDHPAGQEAMALALGLSQQTVSSLIKPNSTYNPGFQVATAIANLDGKRLVDLIGDYGDEPDDESEESSTHEKTATSMPPAAEAGFRNLAVCIEFYAAEKHWSPWTVAAARAGYFGTSDFAAPAWATKLDYLEKLLEKARKVS